MMSQGSAKVTKHSQTEKKPSSSKQAPPIESYRAALNCLTRSPFPAHLSASSCVALSQYTMEISDVPLLATPTPLPTLPYDAVRGHSHVTVAHHPAH